MFKKAIDSVTGRAAFLANLKRGTAKLKEKHAKLAKLTTSMPALEEKIARNEQAIADEEAAPKIHPTVLYIASYLHLCGTHQQAPSTQHMKAIGRGLPSGSKALANCLEDAIALGWATLDERGRFLWTPEGEEELTALHEMHEAKRNWTPEDQKARE